MKRPLAFTCAALLGSLGIYCSQSVIRSTDDGRDDGSAASDGPIGEARADSPAGSCCTTPAPKFVPLGQLTVTDAAPSATLTVAAYRHVVLYLVEETKTGGSACAYAASSSLVEVTFRADSSSPFGAVLGGAGEKPRGRIEVEGTDLQLLWAPVNVQACTGSATYQVAGVVE